MKPVIDDEIYVNMEQQEERGLADLEPTSSEDPIATPFQPHISPAYPPDDTVDVFEGYSFYDRHSTVIIEEEGVPGRVTEPGEDGETEAETILGRNDLTEPTILIAALQSLTPPIQQRPPEPPPVYTEANLAPFPNATLLAVPDIPTQVPAPPPTLPTGVVANTVTTAFARHHRQAFEPKSLHQQSNYKRTHQEKTVVPISERDHDEDVDATYGEGLDNCPDYINVDGESHNGPGSINTVSYYLLSMLAPDTRLTNRQLAVKTFIFDDPELSQPEDCWK